LKKIAIIHDWLTHMGGAENCLQVFLELLPQADLFTSVYDPSKIKLDLNNRSIHTTFIQNLPFSKKIYRNYLPLMPLAFEELNLQNYDFILSSSDACAKGIIPNPRAAHICYCYTPMRYVWDMYYEYMSDGHFARKLVSLFSNYLRTWDAASACRVDKFYAISQFVASRINKYYRREAEVVYPPVDCDYFVPQSKDEEYFLIVSRLVPYKKIDLAVRAFNKLKLPLVVIGEGREEAKLKKMAGPNIKFMGYQSREVIKDRFARCRAFIFPGIEDFGITVLEAQAAGRPVIAFAGGGALETVIEGKTGLFFDEQTPESLVLKVEEFAKMSFDKKSLRQNALKYDRQIFKNKIRSILDENKVF